jgi:hypothetical protein
MKSASMPSGSWAGRLAALFVGLALAFPVHAQGNLEIDTPAISALRKTMQQRHAQLAPLYASGAVGIAGCSSSTSRPFPDIAGLRTLHELPAGLPDYEVAEFAFQRQRARNGSDFLPLHLQRVVVISCALRTQRGLPRLVAGRAEVGRGRDHPALLRRHRENSRRRSCPGTAAASTCRCCTIAG